jgi:hypothetical protein
MHLFKIPKIQKNFKSIFIVWEPSKLGLFCQRPSSVSTA